MYACHDSFFQIKSPQICETHSIRTSMTRSISSPPSFACCCPESSTAVCAGSSFPLSRLLHSKATSLSSKPSPGKASMSWRPTAHLFLIWISARFPSKWSAVPYVWFYTSNNTILRPSNCSISRQICWPECLRKSARWYCWVFF